MNEVTENTLNYRFSCEYRFTFHLGRNVGSNTGEKCTWTKMGAVRTKVRNGRSWDIFRRRNGLDSMVIRIWSERKRKIHANYNFKDCFLRNMKNGSAIY